MWRSWWICCGKTSIQLVTLTGPGGVGKTRLAIECARLLSIAGSDDAVFVSLAPITDAGGVVPAVAQAFGVRESRDESLVDSLADVIGDRRALLILDNFEQVLDAAPIVSDLLTRCTGLSALVTSRARLRIRGEHEVVVAPLNVPDSGMATDYLAAFGAVALFLEGRASFCRNSTWKTRTGTRRRNLPPP